VLLIYSCGSAPQTEAGHVIAPPMDSVETSDQASVAADPVSIVKQINISNINQYIHPKTGLWLIQSSGAMPNMTNTSQVDKNFPVDFSAAQNSSLPKIDCASKTFWTKEGCYVQEINTFKTEKIWTYCGLSKAEEAKVEELAQKISLTAVNTSFSARYYFAQIEGKYYLVFVDLRRPCEA
jgi:hypothetical protein